MYICILDIREYKGWFEFFYAGPAIFAEKKIHSPNFHELHV